MGNKRAVLSADKLCMLHEKYGVSVSALLNRMASLEIMSDALRAKRAAFDRAGNVDKRYVVSSMRFFFLISFFLRVCWFDERLLLL